MKLSKISWQVKYVQMMNYFLVSKWHPAVCKSMPGLNIIAQFCRSGYTDSFSPWFTWHPLNSLRFAVRSLLRFNWWNWLNTVIPFLIYFVGFGHPHMAIDNAALVLGINAYLNQIQHTHKGNMNYRASDIFIIPRIVDFLLGSELKFLTPGTYLLFFSSIMMVAIALY